MFSRADSIEKALVLLIVAAGFGAISYLTIEGLWGLLAALGVAVCIGLFTYEIRSLFGRVDESGTVIPHGLVTVLVYGLPWIAIAVNVYVVNVRPALANEAAEVPLIWAIVIAVALFVLQIMRRSAVRQIRGDIPERVEGFLRYPRTFVRRWSKRLAGLDLHGEEVKALTGVDFVAKRIVEVWREFDRAPLDLLKGMA